MKKFIIKVNGNEYEVEVEEVKQEGMEGQAIPEIKTVNPAPANPAPVASQANGNAKSNNANNNKNNNNKYKPLILFSYVYYLSLYKYLKHPHCFDFCHQQLYYLSFHVIF
jgi:hypothetical protein